MNAPTITEALVGLCLSGGFCLFGRAAVVFAELFTGRLSSFGLSQKSGGVTGAATAAHRSVTLPPPQKPPALPSSLTDVHKVCVNWNRIQLLGKLGQISRSTRVANLQSQPDIRTSKT